MKTIASLVAAACLMFGLLLGVAMLIAPRAVPTVRALPVRTRYGPAPEPPRGSVLVPRPRCICCGWSLLWFDGPRVELKALAPPPALPVQPAFGRIEVEEPDAPRVAPLELAKRFMCLPRTTVEPQYPRSARRRRIEGEVRIDVSIDRSGSVRSAAVLHAEPAGVFEQAALRAVRRWRYDTFDDSLPESCERTQVRLRFELPR